MGDLRFLSLHLGQRPSREAALGGPGELLHLDVLLLLDLECVAALGPKLPGLALQLLLERLGPLARCCESF